MAISTTSQVLLDGPRNFVIRITGVEDGSGLQLTNLKVIDVTAMSPPAGPSLKIMVTQFAVFGGIVQLLWDAPTPRVFAELQLADDRNHRSYGGQSTLGVPGATGSVLLSTLGFDLGSSYDIVFECIKGIGTPTG